MQSPVLAADSKVQLMFVQSAESVKADDKTLRLVNVSPQTIYFSDRPKRVAGHVTMPAYLEEWTAAAGPNNFAKDPPNATLSVYEPGQRANALTVIVISQPVARAAVWAPDSMASASAAGGLAGAEDPGGKCESTGDGLDENIARCRRSR